MDAIRRRVEEREAQTLSPFAQLAIRSQGREREENPDPVRTCYQRDRDRVLHSKPFRRLKHKTQVFIEPAGDHFRTRLTHSLEVAQISRTVARALFLNEDLTEAIALSHDVGHSPFGHAGEQALDEAVKEAGFAHGPTHFKHDEHSLRVVDILTPLNLTEETRQGIQGHSKGRNDLRDQDGIPTSTLEAAVVRLCDRIAYLNHDLDDAVRAGIIRQIPHQFLTFGKSQGERIGEMVADLIGNSIDSPRLVLSEPMREAMNEMKDWLYRHVYLAEPEPMTEVRKAQRLVQALFRYYVEFGLPKDYDADREAPEGRRVLDYVAGMTDRFAISTYEKLFIPERFRELVDVVP